MRGSKLVVAMLLGFSSVSLSASDVLSKEELGQILFFDKN